MSQINKKEYLALLSLLIICVLPVLYYELANSGSLLRFLTSTLYALPFCLLLTCFPRKGIFSLVVTILTIMSMMEIVMVALYNNYLSAGNILAVFTTTKDEGVDFLLNTFHAFPYIIPCIVAYVLTLSFFEKNKKPLLCLSLAVLFSVASFGLILVRTNKAKQTLRFYITQNVLERPPYNFIDQLTNVIEQLKIRRLIESSESMSFGATHELFDGKETYVLAIGESCRYNNLSLAGYGRSTTPMLDNLDNVVLYSNYYATANLTMYSVPQILTRATVDDFELNYKEKSIFQPFKECGFKTFAICCKNLLSYEIYLTNGVDSLYCVQNDKDIPRIIKSLSSQYQKTFFIVQFWGNHGFYSNFDDSCNVYHPNIVSEPQSKDSQLYVNSYDNTILYMDKNLSSIIKNIDTYGNLSAFLFVSDHGEDFRTGIGGHGGNSKPNKEEYHVPFIFWHSNTWSERYPSKVNNLLKNKDCPINSDNVFYTVCDMAAIQLDCRYAQPKWSVLSDSLQLHERYLLVPDGKSKIKLE